jgi:hypothetical protein
MRGLLFVITVLWIALGTVMVLYTEATRSSAKGLFAAANIRVLAILPGVLGLLLLMGAFMVREVFWLALPLGILGVAKGAFLAFGPATQIQQLREWWFERASETVVRLSGLLIFMFGVAILSWLL